MDADILQAIRIIDDKIASLQEARNRLATAFGIVGQPSMPASRESRTRPAAPTPTTAPNAVMHPQPSDRKVQLANFLLQNGPMSRAAIVEKSGIPEGTVSYCLSDKRFFEQGSDGDWNINDYSRRGLERRSFAMEHEA